MDGSLGKKRHYEISFVFMLVLYNEPQFGYRWRGPFLVGGCIGKDDGRSKGATNGLPVSIVFNFLFSLTA